MQVPPVGDRRRGASYSSQPYFLRPLASLETRLQLNFPSPSQPKKSPTLHCDGVLVASESSSSALTKNHRVFSDHRLRLADVHAAAHHPHCSTSWRRIIQELQTRVFCTALPPRRPCSCAAPSTPRLAPLLVLTRGRASNHMEAKRRRRSWLGDLLFDVLIQITGNVAVTSWLPMEDLRALRGT